MPLNNFGAILTFAEECETRLQSIYADFAGAAVPADHQTLFSELAKEGDRYIREIQRARRENVTEMILESIHGFSREAYLIDGAEIQIDDAAAVLNSARELEERISRYYLDAADKLKALSEVARTLKMLAKKHNRRYLRLQSI